MSASLPGRPPAAPPWGQVQVALSPELARRLPAAGSTGEVALVLGAGGALGPDVVHGLLRTGHTVVGADVQLSYVVEGATYRHLDLCDPDAVHGFLADLVAWVEAEGLQLGAVYDLAAVQTNPRSGGDRGSLGAGKRALIDALCALPGDRALFAMSTAEVYGAPEGAPYAEGSSKQPFNAYGRGKWSEEQALVAAHGRPTASGTLRVTALRTWTIAMVCCAPDGAILEARNYNDPLIAIAERLARAGVRVPVVDPELLCVFHLSEEVAEVVVRMGSAGPEAPWWGRALNCVGRPATHGALVETCFAAFAGRTEPPWWSGVARLALGRRLPRSVLVLLAGGLQRAGGLWGARDLGSRLPFLYRSTHLDTSELQGLLGPELTVPAGSESELAVARLVQGIAAGGPDAANMRRYRMY